MPALCAVWHARPAPPCIPCRLPTGRRLDGGARGPHLCICAGRGAHGERPLGAPRGGSGASGQTPLLPADVRHSQCPSSLPPQYCLPRSPPCCRCPTPSRSAPSSCSQSGCTSSACKLPRQCGLGRSKQLSRAASLRAWPRGGAPCCDAPTWRQPATAAGWMLARCQTVSSAARVLWPPTAARPAATPTGRGSPQCVTGAGGRTGGAEGAAATLPTDHALRALRWPAAFDPVLCRCKEPQLTCGQGTKSCSAAAAPASGAAHAPSRQRGQLHANPYANRSVACRCAAPCSASM